MEEKEITRKKVRHPLRTPRRYRLSFINENTFNEVWTLKFTGPKMIAAVAFLIFTVGCIVATIIVITPIRTLLPGYLKKEQRQENIVNYMRIDSLSEIVTSNNAYMRNITQILNPSSKPEKQSLPNTEEIAAQSPDSLLAASETEKMFVRRFEEAEKFNLKIKSPAAAGGIAFFAPVNGAVIMPSEETTAVTLATPPNATVCSIYHGTIIGTYATLQNGLSVVVQHPNGFVSKYSGLTSLFSTTGDKVETGSALGLSGEKEGNPHVIVELWNDGTALNPTDYIPF